MFLFMQCSQAKGKFDTCYMLGLLHMTFMVGGTHTCDISLFWRVLPIFEQISLFGISNFPYKAYTSPCFKFQISLFEIKNFLLCLIILPILKSKSPYLASQMYHMYGDVKPQIKQTEYVGQIWVAE